MSNPSSDWLQQAIGIEPFPWQHELLRRFCAGEDVSSLDIPTGLGKTAVMAIWLVARALGAKLPRRIVYVVDRRAVVDQATEVAEALRAWVKEKPDVANALGLDDRPLPISTLRGQHVDNREWLADPSLPAIIVGTVDMVGSRLLFSGYGVSSKMRPYHAGLLGADALVVLDEAHLVPAFEDLLRQVERGADAFGPKQPSLRGLVPEFKLLSLSATGRQTDATTLTLSDDDRSHAIIKKRLTAKKALRIVDFANGAQATATPADGNSADDTDETTKKNKGPKLADVLARQAWEVTTQGSAPVRCLVFCNARKDATAVAAELRNLAKSAKSSEPTIELLVGGRRVKERTQARDALARLGFLAGTAVSLERSAFLIATSAGEVGVDLDADHMVCDLVTWERMVQRLGRVNRRGDGHATIVVVVEAAPPDEDGLRAAWQSLGDMLPKEQKRTLELFDKRRKANEARDKLKQANLQATERRQRQKDLGAFKDGDAKKLAEYEAEVRKQHALRKLLAAIGEQGSLSPDALLTLRARPDLADALRAATTAEPLRPELTRPLVDAWSMTSLDEHPGRPEVDPWLRGFRPNDPPQTTVVWRRFLPVLADGSFDAKAAKRFFEAAPPHTSEQLETETFIVLDWLIERAATIAGAKEPLLEAEQVVAVALGRRGEVKDWRTLTQLAALKSKGKHETKEGKKAREQAVKALEQLLVGAMLVIDARLGGLKDGLLNDNENTRVTAADDDSGWLIRPDVEGVPVTGFRIRQWVASQEHVPAQPATSAAGWVQRYRFVTDEVNGEPSEVLVVEGWVGDAAVEEERAEANRPQRLEEHQSWAEDCARQVAQRLGIEQRLQNLLALAARLHDEGKRAPRWQRAFKAPIEGRPYAKTKGPIDFDLLDGYRHELGSLPYVEAHEDFQALGRDDQDFVLHLIAAHHGFARPLIGTSGCDDAPPSIVEERARAVALRFARLSRRWGPWGLAWWEALLRAADQIASRRNQQTASAQEEQP
jgi:CRISPR-associated endonuclease/helicase Cas3